MCPTSYLKLNVKFDAFPKLNVGTPNDGIAEGGFAEGSREGWTETGKAGRLGEITVGGLFSTSTKSVHAVPVF